MIKALVAILTCCGLYYWHPTNHKIYHNILIQNKRIPFTINIDTFVKTLVKEKWKVSQNDLKSLAEYVALKHDSSKALIKSIK